MKTVTINYNPYMVKTDIQIDNKAIDESVSPLRYVSNKRLQEWIEPKGAWPGVFDQLRASTGDDQIRIEFVGTFGDFEDMKYAKDRFGGCFSSIELVHANEKTAGDADPYKKMEKLNELYQKLQEGPVEEFKTEDIRKNFDEAMNSDFRIVIVAPMSSGKSTLINAIIGKDLLPAVNQATTAVITEIKDNDDFENFIVNASDKYGKVVAKDEIATKKLISELNYMKDPKDSEGKDALIHLVKIEGPIPNLPSKELSTVFVDTPGGNNSQNDEHEEMMDEAINDENKSLILYVFNGTQLGTNDSNIILKKIANAMKNSTNGKQSRDRFLFVANRMDDIDIQDEPYEEVIENTILPQLASNGITEPNLFLVSAQTAKLIRMVENGEELSETEDENYGTLIKRFNKSGRMLGKYSSLSLSDKEMLCDEVETYMTQAENCNLQAKETDSVKEMNKLKEQENKLKEQAAEINSGVPALELAIRNYLEKYAIAIKIKTVHDTFMKKVYERNMIDNCEAEWAQSEEIFNKIKAEIKKKQKETGHKEKLKQFKDEVDAIKFDREIIDEKKANIRLEMDILVDGKPEEVEKAQAEEIVLKFSSALERIGEEADVEIYNEINNGILRSCSEIVDKYSKYVKELDEDGSLSIGNFDIKNTESFEAFDIGRPDDLLSDEEYNEKRDVDTGKTRKVKKPGFLNGIKRFLNIDSGWRDEPIIRQGVEFIKLKKLMQDQITAVGDIFDDEFNEKMNETNSVVNKLKDITMKKLDGLEKMISDMRREIAGMVKDREKLSERVKKNEEKAKWIKEFISEVDDLLTV